ncbi:S49 family peptidase [Agrobacterium sp. SHOUNA12C]|uniref:Protease protein n=1 Tax=Rhizobium rhizogenes (strain K84 / ATCC BAA-868) TaxID=311403 RepID=B9JA45_RHIR8|nr:MULTISPECIES: S49 family peptidase [Rhizobium]ACM25662.1 protease protein [Rhizobium rhizogenes K84]KAA6483736.1 S49 family peptidase [Agrobacterium sp. ICMP 7243]MCJ9720974.1 S49 family peptidase [Agrobacterium sp. BETTINA12B]MCJ9757631.1 S49 family peptidase [Agrobacterium sp. SHOUNA12C]OCI98260.1 peptidase S49 [Agrobacterium sp. 13-626]OCJ21984.1 peptidase S49 [Agrobacterium sp. B131/95]OCJ26573.1 peptidase S49 [Agrobacterium sp. B133/95]
MAGFFKRMIPKRFRKERVVIPVVRLSGAIASGGGPLRQSLNLAGISQALEKAFEMKAAPAIALVVNSPGGSPVQSRMIYNRIRDLAQEKQKKVLVFVEDVAASGGYMIALAGDEIIADATSIVGSIGVVSGGFGFPELLKKLGVERRVYTAGENKVILDPFQPEKEKDIEYLKSLQLEIHKVFIDMVRERRAGKLTDDDTVFSGLFWTGGRGLELGLIDGLGDMRQELKKRFGEKTKLVLVGTPRSLFGRRAPGVSLAGMDGIGAGLASGLAQAAEEKALWGRYGL